MPYISTVIENLTKGKLKETEFAWKPNYQTKEKYESRISLLMG
jgi:hypothetical protein